MTLTRSTLPQRSPMPFIVPCTCVAPARTAASVFATASSQSLWQWMPISHDKFARARVGDHLGDLARACVPPLVSQRMTTAGTGTRPRLAASAGRTRGWPGSRRRSARRRRTPRGPATLQYATESAIIRRFSSSVVPSTLVTCKSHVLPTMVTTGVSASSSAFRHGVVLRRRVLPPGHAEGDDLRVLQGQLAHRLEVLEVLGVRERIAALDEIDAQFVEPAGEQQLVLQGEVDALALAAVAKCGVVDGDAAHGVVLATGGVGKKKPRSVCSGVAESLTFDPVHPVVTTTATTARTPCAMRITIAAGVVWVNGNTMILPQIGI